MNISKKAADVHRKLRNKSISQRHFKNWHEHLTPHEAKYKEMSDSSRHLDSTVENIQNLNV